MASMKPAVRGGDALLLGMVFYDAKRDWSPTRKFTVIAFCNSSRWGETWESSIQGDQAFQF
jgi:hypothetical protein